MNNLTDLLHYGVVEARDTDPLRLGRCKVRVIGLHTELKEELPTEDLPWAYPISPLGSAAMSGIGHSPVGPVEGTIVIVLFRDVYKQHPLILGSLGGIPEEFPEYKTTIVNSTASRDQVDNDRQLNVLTDGSGSTVTDSSGNPVATGETEKKEDTSPLVKKPGGMSASENGKNFSKDNEGLASLSKDKRKVGNTKSNISDSTKIYSYQDSGGVWTIGWGNTKYADGSSVKGGDSITKAEADTLYESRHQEAADAVNRDLKVPVTQSMFDSLVDMSYNMGHTGLTKSKMWNALSNGRYEEASALIPSTRATVKGQPNEGLKNRRKKEQDLFLKDGIPSKDLSEVKPNPSVDEDKQKEDGITEDKTQNPAVRKNQSIKKENEDGSQSFSQTITDQREDKESDGFRDPNGVYPLKQFLNEPDTHRLARHEKIDETIVPIKEAARVESVPIPFGRTWDQSKVPYNALYPFNHVFVSESGHVQEFDDTKGNERIHTYHKSGTFEEIDLNGSRVNRIVGDGYEIFERNGYVLVRGECGLTVEGSVRIRVENNADIQVLGNCKTEVTGNMETSVKGDYKLKAATIQLETYQGDMDVKVAGVYAEDAATIYMNSGVAVPTGLNIPSEAAKGDPEFAPLEVPDRSNEYQGNYESEEEGDNTEFIKGMKENGIAKPGQMRGQPKSGSEAKTPAQEKPAPKPEQATGNTDPTEKAKDCCENDDIPEGPYSASTKLVGNWTLGDIAKGRSGIPNSSSYGMSAKEIVSNLKCLTQNILDPIKKKYPNMVITNTWRSEAVNSSIRGASKTSDHLKGQAADIQFSGFDRKQTYEAAIEIQKMLPDYDQILLEYSGNSMWLHISYKCPSKGGNRRETKTIDVFNKKNNVNNEFVLYDKR